MKAGPKILENKNAVAWILMVSMVAIHVFDEAVNDFLPFYNNMVLDLRESIGFFPLPTFSFEAWLVGLIIAVVISFSLTPIVIRGGGFISLLTTVLGVIMIINALIHIIGSIYLGKLMPGFWSSPFLLAAAIFVVVRGFSGSNQAGQKNS